MSFKKTLKIFLKHSYLSIYFFFYLIFDLLLRLRYIHCRKLKLCASLKEEKKYQ